MFDAIAKPLIDIAVSTSVGAIVSNAVRATTPDNLNTYGKVVVGIGSFVTAAAIGSLASKHVTNGVDEFIGNFQNKTTPDNTPEI